jgi:hypothetical protein
MHVPEAELFLRGNFPTGALAYKATNLQEGAFNCSYI